MEANGNMIMHSGVASGKPTQKVIGNRLSGRLIEGFHLKERVLTLEFNGGCRLEISAQGDRHLNLRLFDETGTIRE